MSIIKEMSEYVSYLLVGTVAGVGAGYILFHAVEILTPMVK